jgi:hypothetical protein
MSNVALALFMIALFITAAVLILRNKRGASE